MRDFIIFTDLDGTLIRPAKNRPKNDPDDPDDPDYVVVERKNGEAITCVSAGSIGLFGKLTNTVPVTTRSIGQYKRVEIPGFKPEYALCSNGGNLLENGSADADWYEASLNYYERCKVELERCREVLENDPNRSLETRLVDGLFLFTKSSDVQKSLDPIKEFASLNCFSVGKKLYALPKELDKGSAVRRFIVRLKRQGFRGTVICAGDSLPDVSMLNLADTAVFPDDLEGVTAKTILTAPREIFCDFAAEQLAKICDLL